MPNFMRSITLWLVVAVVLVVLFQLSQGGFEPNGHDRLDFSDFLNKVNAGDVEKVTIKKTPDAPSSTILGKYKSGERFITFAPEDPGLVDILLKKNVTVSAAPDNSGMRSSHSTMSKKPNTMGTSASTGLVSTSTVFPFKSR